MSITPPEKSQLSTLHDDYTSKVRVTSVATATASTLIICAVIVIGCASLCLTLPGVNAMQQVVLPGILPGAGGILLATPFIILAVKKTREKNAVRKTLIDTLIPLINKCNVPEMKHSTSPKTSKHVKHRAKFLKNTFFDKSWAPEYNRKLVSDLKERLPKKEEDQNYRQKRLVKALDHTISLLSPSKEDET
ncbi:MAG: hypothetical protein K940chlam9_00682 [Chlamydiae bacterium]|nr:hypothetical protein [Chlamydiota bacterium]